MIEGGRRYTDDPMGWPNDVNGLLRFLQARLWRWAMICCPRRRYTDPRPAPVDVVGGGGEP